MNTNSYFTVEILSSGNINLIMSSSSGTPITVYYWKNKEPNATRSNYDGSITTTTTAQNISNLVAGDKIKFYRAETTALSGSESNSWFNKLTGTSQFKISGNIASLVGFSDTLPEHCFRRLFYYSSTIIDAGELDLPWNTLSTECYTGMFYSCSNLTVIPSLPATTLADYCYQYMFRQCTSLTKAQRILPATTLVTGCYYWMFGGCTVLETAPELPALSLVSNCYYNLFGGCRALNYIKAMFTTTPGSGYTNSWLYSVAANGTFIKNSTATWTTSDQSGIPSGWTVKNMNPQTQSLDFNNVNAVYVKGNIGISAIYGQNNQLLWTKKDEPISTDYLTLQALEDGKISFNIAYNSGSYISELSKTIYYSKNNSAWTSITFSASYENSYIDVVAGDKIRLKGTNSRYALNSESANNNHDYIIGTGSFKVYGNIMSLINGDDFVGTSFNNNNTYAFTGLFWGLHNSQYVSKLTSVSEIYLPEAIQGTYWSLFAHCHYLEQAPVQELSISLLSGLSHNHEMSAMFINTAIQTAPTLPSLTVYESSYTQMFEGCTELVNAPSILPATTLSPYCYSKMFNRCSKLVTAPVLPATTLVTWCYTNMFLNCSALRYIKALFTTTPSNSYTGSWVSGCSNTSDFIFVKNSAATWTTTGDNAVLSNWTIQYEAA